MEKRKERHDRDRLELLTWLWFLPLAMAAQLVEATALTNNRVHRLLTGMRERDLVVRVTFTGTGRQQERWWLTSLGARAVGARHNAIIPMQVTEGCIDRLISRMPMVEHCYDLALKLQSHPGVCPDRPVIMFPDVNEGPFSFLQGLRLHRFIWYSDGAVDAVAEYENHAWVAMIWVGPEVTYHRLLTLVKESLETPGATWHREHNHRLNPAGWVVVCADRAAAALAAEVWPGDNVMVVTVDGHLARTMRPGDCSLRVATTGETVDLGRPERIARQQRNRPDIQFLQGELFYLILRYIADFRAATPAQLKRRFGDRYSKVIAKLQKRGLIVKLDDGFYATLKGGRVLADMDGVDPMIVEDRLKGLLGRNNDYRRQQQRHDRAVVDVEWKMWEQGIPAFAGRRNLRNFPGVTQVSPDLVLCLDRGDGSTVLVNVEVEFTARDRRRMEGKVGPYRLADRHADVPTLSIWLFEDRATEGRYAEEMQDLLALTSTLDEFLDGPLRGPDSVLRLGDQRVSIDKLVDLMDTAEPEDRDY